MPKRSDEEIKSHGKARSSHWRTKRREILAKQPRCVVCGGKHKLEVHHIDPFHLAPEKELLDDNLIVLCESNPHFNCHLIVGHLLCFSRINSEVRRDAAFLREHYFSKILKS